MCHQWAGAQGITMAADARVLELFSYYRDAELRGAAILLRLLKLLDTHPAVQTKLTLHIAQEAHHAWLWTKRIAELGGKPVRIEAGYQTRIGMRTLPTRRRGPARADRRRRDTVACAL